MKTPAIFLTILLGVSGLFAQIPRHIPITDAEYFINADPGQGNGTHMSLTPGFTVDFSAIAGVLQNDDRIYVRVKSERNAWSTPFGVRFDGTSTQRHQFLTKAEYFVNRDPGAGNGIPLSGSFPGNPVSIQSPHVSINSASDIFFVRTTNSGVLSSAPIAAKLGANPIIAARTLRVRHPVPGVTAYDTLGMNLTDSPVGGLVGTAATEKTGMTFFAEGDTLLIQMKGKNEVWGPGSMLIYHAPAPTLTNINPKNGTRLQTLDVTFTGTNFLNGATSVNVGAGITVNSATVTDPTSLKANLTITATAATGSRNFAVTNGTLVSGSQAFTVNNPAPTLAAISPTSGGRGQTLEVTFTGTNFISGVTSVTAGNGITVNSVTVDNSTSLKANLTITSAAATGDRSFSVSNPAPGGGTSGSQTFTVNNSAPALTSIAPTNGNRGQTLDVVFAGTNFITGASMVNVGTGIRVNSVTVISATQLKASLTISDTASVGARGFSVTNPAPGGGTSSSQTFTINNPGPTITAIAPTSGSRGQTLSLVITGTNFINRVTSLSLGNDITVNSMTVNSGTKITAQITINANAAHGARNVTVTNPAPGGATAILHNGFTVGNPIPTLASIAPVSGNRLQTLEVTFTGTDFMAGITSVDVGAEITVNSTTVTSGTSLKANITISAEAATGARRFKVINGAPGGGSSAGQDFAVGNPAPALTKINPSSAHRGETINVGFKGKNYLNGVSRVDAAADVTVNSVTVHREDSLTARLSIGQSVALGAYSFSVTNSGPGGGTSENLVFRIVNKAPTKPRLLVPANKDTIKLFVPVKPVRFAWRRSSDSDWQDTLRYAITVTGPGLDTTVAGVRDSSTTLNIMPRLKLASTYLWTVKVTDGIATVASPDTFRFRSSDRKTGVDDDYSEIPTAYLLEQNYPNPFNPSTKIRFELPERARVRLEIYDVLGQEIATLVDEEKQPGKYEVEWQPPQTGSGVYFYRLQSDDFVQVKKMVLAR